MFNGHRQPLARFMLLAVALSGAAWCRAGDVSPIAVEDNLIERFHLGAEGYFLVVPVTLDGETYPFVLDTGATHCVYDTALRPWMGKQRTMSTMVRTAGGSAQVELYDSPDARLGRVSLRGKQTVVCADLNMVRQISGQNIYGLVGMDVLRRYVVRFDPDDRMLELLHRVPADSGVAVPLVRRRRLLSGASRLAFVEADVGRSSPATFLIDTGAVGNPGTLDPALFGRLAREAKLQVLGSTVSESLSGSAQNQIGRLGQVAIGGYWHRDLTFSQSKDNKLGLDYWSRYVVTFDFAHDALYLRPSRQFNRRAPHDLSGLTLLSSTGKLRVLHVLPDSPAARAGVARGDVVLRVGRLDSRRDSLFAIRRLLSTPGVELPIVVQRGGTHLLMPIALSEPRLTSPIAVPSRPFAKPPVATAGRPIVGARQWLKKLF
ncbi:MAG TPA: aspartyl protease family protein [Pirellulales bacterium]|nr:aspartyl protease family protein [Pirellulales bacterium]